MRRSQLKQSSGKQPGDPVRAADAIIKAVESDDPPLHLVLGKMALERAREALTNRLAHLRRVGARHAFGRLSEVTAAVAGISIEPVTGALGAEVLGVDLAQHLTDADVRAVREAFLRHGVIFFRDQHLDVPRHKAFASRFGTLFLHPNIQGSSADPAVIDIVRNPGDTKIIGEDWHSDTPQVAAASDGLGAVRGRRAAVRRRHAVREPVRGLRRAVAGLKIMLDGVRALHSDRRVAGPARDLGQSNAAKKKSDDEWRETANLPSRRTHASRDRPQGAVRQPADRPSPSRT